MLPQPTTTAQTDSQWTFEPSSSQLPSLLKLPVISSDGLFNDFLGLTILIKKISAGREAKWGHSVP